MDYCSGRNGGHYWELGGHTRHSESGGHYWEQGGHTRHSENGGAVAGIAVPGRIVGREFSLNGSRLDRICMDACAAAQILLLPNEQEVMPNPLLTPQLHFIVHRPSFRGG